MIRTLPWNVTHFPQELSLITWSLAQSIELTAQRLQEYDVVANTADHSSYDYPAIVCHARLIIDTRNATRYMKENREKIIRC